MPDHRLHIPSSALRMSRGNMSDEDVLLVVTVISSSLFQVNTSARHFELLTSPESSCNFCIISAGVWM